MEFRNTGKRIEYLIKSKNFKQIDVCLKTGISKNAMSNYIKGYRIPDTTALYKLAFFLGTSMEWILTGIDTHTQKNLCCSKYSHLFSELEKLTKENLNHVELYIKYKVECQKEDFANKMQDYPK